MPLRISVYASRELEATITVCRGLEKAVQAAIRTQTRSEAGPIWTAEVAQHAVTRVETRVLADTARVAVSNQNVTLKSASSVKRLPGGLVPAADWSAIEFGADDRDKRVKYESHSRKGSAFTVNRRTRKQLRDRKAGGHVVYPSLADSIPRFASLWVQTTMRVTAEQLNA